MDPVDRIQQRMTALKSGDPSEALPEPEPRQVEPIAKGSTRAPQKRREHPMKPTATAAGATAEGSTSTMTKTATKPKRTTTKKAAAKTTAPKAKTNGAELDTRALPFVIEWKSNDGTFTGKSLTGDWGNARYRIKGYLDKGHKPDDVRAGLSAALDAVRVGRDFQIHDVKITCTKR